MRKYAYGTGLIVSNKITQVKNIEQRVLPIEGLSFDCPKLNQPNGQGHTNENGFYHIDITADGAAESAVKGLYDDLKPKVRRIDFSSFSYRKG